MARSTGHRCPAPPAPQQAVGVRRRIGIALVDPHIGTEGPRVLACVGNIAAMGQEDVPNRSMDPDANGVRVFGRERTIIARHPVRAKSGGRRAPKAWMPSRAAGVQAHSPKAR